MITLPDLPAPSEHVAAYGRAWRPGVLTEHLEEFERAGGSVRPRTDGGLWAVDETGRAYPVVCSDIIRIDTEDGPMSGRCGHVAVADGACPAHAEARASWAALTEAERIAWEHAQEAYA